MKLGCSRWWDARYLHRLLYYMACQCPPEFLNCRKTLGSVEGHRPSYGLAYIAWYLWYEQVSRLERINALASHDPGDGIGWDGPGKERIKGSSQPIDICLRAGSTRVLLRCCITGGPTANNGCRCASNMLLGDAEVDQYSCIGPRWYDNVGRSDIPVNNGRFLRVKIAKGIGNRSQQR